MEYGEEEYIDDEVVQSAFQQQTMIQSEYQNNLRGNYQYDEVEAI